jgi:hypothetical protein
VTPGYENIFLKGDSKRQLRSNHQKGHVNKDGVYIKHTEMRGKKKVKPQKTDKPPRRPMDPNNRGQGRPNLTRPMNFELGGINMNRQAPKLPPNMNLGGQGGFRAPPVGGISGNLGNIPHPSMRPQNLPPSNLPPQGNMPPSNLPPQGNMPPSNFPPSHGSMPPMGAPQGMRMGGFPNPMGAPGNFPGMQGPPRPMPPMPGSLPPQYQPKPPQAPPSSE